MRSSQAAVDLIVAAEIGSKAQYDKKYQRPEWPGGKSGVTVAIGYDLGYATRGKVQQDFGPYLPSAMVAAMQNVVGLKGQDAKRALAGVRDKVIVPWSAAMKVFEAVDLPRYEAMLIKACPGAENLPADCFGALASITYNRGPGGFTGEGDRYREMRLIRAAIVSKNYQSIPKYIRDMKRIWVNENQPGLLTRRDNEAKLFEIGLKKPNELPPWLTNRGDEPAEKPATPAGNRRKGYDMQVEALQKNLREMNYHEVGDVDGTFGGKTRAAIVAFMTDRGKYPPGDGSITPEVVAEINDAVEAGWTRPIKEERKNATAKDIANKVPSVNQTWWQKLWAYALGVPSAFGAVFKWLFGDQTNVGDYIEPVKNFFAGIPPELYLLAVAVIAAAVFIQAKRAQDATVESYRKGEIN